MYVKHLFKTPGLSMLVAVGVMAVSASAVQAKWVSKVGSNNVLHLRVQGEKQLIRMSVPSLGLAIHCETGDGVALIQVTENHKSWSASATGENSSCVVEEFEEFCEVHSKGEPDGTIQVTGSGEGQMEGEKTFAELSSEEFTNVIISDPLEICPFANIDGRINGSVTLTIDQPTEHAQTHTMKLDEQELFYGNAPATLEGKGGGSMIEEMEEESGQSWSLGLTGL